MKQFVGGLLLIAAAALSFTACPGGIAICNKSVSLSSKVGNCSVPVEPGSVLGPMTTCSSRATSCTAAEQSGVENALSCIDGLPVCDSATQAEWQAKLDTCNSGLSGLSAACKDALFYGGVLPGQDGGADAGPYVDAGRRSIDDGGHGVSFIAVADENSFAFAWVPLQPAGIASWELNSFDTTLSAGVGVRLPDIGIPGGATRVFQQDNVGNMVARRFYIAGLDSTGLLAQGVVVDAGMDVDAGVAMCTTHLACTILQVCDLGTCRTQDCQAAGMTCPVDYICNPNVTPNRCERTGSTMVIDAGPMMGGPSGSLPMISPSISVKTGGPQYSETFIGGFQARRPDMVAIDSARQFVAMEQGGEPVGHTTVSRGKDFVLDQQSASIIDTVGTNVKVAYNSESQTIFACYSVGRGVRVRSSHDFGRSWGVPTAALTIEPVDDGGTSALIGDCDIAPWKNGTALLVTVDEDAVVTRQITDGLALNGNPDVAFVSSVTDGGGTNVFNPRRPSIATLPSADLTHIGFTAYRIVGNTTDSDIFGVFRDPQTGGSFSPVQFIDAPGNNGMGTGLPQDHVRVEIDPITHKGIAVWTALESQGAGTYTTVYLAFFASNRKWITGSDLSVFMNTTAGFFPLFPQRSTGLWDAFSPQLAIMPSGRIWVMALAGQRDLQGGANDIYSYGVEFSLDAGSPVGGQGWFKPPMVKMSDTKAVDPRAGGNQIPYTNTAFAADSQLSIYSTFIEGIGLTNSEENRGVFVSRP